METNLERFVNAQKYSYNQALAEIKAGHKRSHWMWYIFPQISGLGYSPNAVYYAIKSIDEAKAYLQHPILSVRLIEISEALLMHKTISASEILGSIDAMKLHSCMTLFHIAAPECSTFQRVLHHYFQGNLDTKTQQILKEMEASQ